MRLPSSRRAGLLLCAFACAWAILILLAPFLGRPGGGALGARVAAATFVAGSVVCHQRAERSFHLAGSQLPVCARCTGLYLAGAAGLVWAQVRRRRNLAGGWSRPSPFSWREILAASVLPIVVSVAGELVGAWEGTNAWRALSALPAGCAVGVMLIESLSFQGKL